MNFEHVNFDWDCNISKTLYNKTQISCGDRLLHKGIFKKHVHNPPGFWWLIPGSYWFLITSDPLPEHGTWTKLVKNASLKINTNNENVFLIT